MQKAEARLAEGKEPAAALEAARLKAEQVQQDHPPQPSDHVLTGLKAGETVCQTL